MANPSVFIIGGNYEYRSMFSERGWEIVDNLYDCDLVQFTGGEDVSPHLYDEPRHPKTGNNPARDEKETLIFKQSLELGLPMAGICRGGQFLNVMSGGKMWQHVNNHTGTHKATVSGYVGEVIVSSTHHQMMRPPDDIEHIVLMTANLSTNKECMMGSEGNSNIVRRYIGAKNTEDDVESVYYPDTNCLCYQPHPEFHGFGRCRDIYFHFIENYLMPKVSFRDGVEVIQKNYARNSTVISLFEEIEGAA